MAIQIVTSPMFNIMISHSHVSLREGISSTTTFWNYKPTQQTIGAPIAMVYHSRNYGLVDVKETHTHSIHRGFVTHPSPRKSEGLTLTLFF